ncbi:MAG: PIN domain-containing protein [Candidatus Hydrothermarchaeales archaeon]
MKAYLDTNIFIIMLYFPESSSAKIISACGSEIFTPVISEYSVTEVLENVKRNLGKDIASSLRELIFSIPKLVIVRNFEIKDKLEEFKELVADLDDIPHIAAYFHAECDIFVTSNRKLTQMKIKDRVIFKTPDDFLEML